MKPYTTAAIVVFLAALGFAAWSVIGRKVAAPEALTDLPQPLVPAASPFTRTSEEGPVTVAVTPVDLSRDPLEFEIAMDTHSVPLDADLQSVAVLRDAAGKTYAPLSVGGEAPGGHHRQSIVTFSRPASPGMITLILRDIGGVPERTFAWNP